MNHSSPTTEMEVVTDLRQPASIVNLPPVKYVSMEEFMQTQNELEATSSSNSTPQLKKQKKDITTLESQTVAFHEDVQVDGKNWVGLLQRFADVHPDHRLNYESIVLGGMVPRFQYVVTLQGFPERFGQHDENPQVDVGFSTKTLAKQFAAKKAVDWLVLNKHMPGDGSVKFAKPQSPTPGIALEKDTLEALGNENWVGRLNEHLIAQGKGLPTYKELHTGGMTPRFYCVVNLLGVEESFGCSDTTSKDFVTFSAKKPAKQYAARKAMEWLLSSHRTPSKRSPTSASPAQGTQQPTKPATPATPTPTQPQTQPYTALVPTLCHRLDFQPPSYKITPTVSVPNCSLWEGYADFAGHPRIGNEGRVGYVSSVFGKQNAKEELAKQVYGFLKGVEADRLRPFEDEGKKKMGAPSDAKEALANQVNDFLEGVEADRLKPLEDEDKKRKRASSGENEQDKDTMEG